MQVAIRDEHGKQIALADVVDGTDGMLCVHKAVGPAVRLNGQWSVAHVPTGFLLSWHPTRERAVEVAVLIWSHISRRQLIRETDPDKAARAFSAATRKLIGELRGT